MAAREDLAALLDACARDNHAAFERLYLIGLSQAVRDLHIYAES